MSGFFKIQQLPMFIALSKQSDVLDPKDSLLGSLTRPVVSLLPALVSAFHLYLQPTLPTCSCYGGPSLLSFSTALLIAVASVPAPVEQAVLGLGNRL